MEKAIELKEHNYKNFNFCNIDRVYMFDAFCQNLIPTINDIDSAYKFIKDNNIQFTLNTPFVTNCGIEKILKNIEYISKYEEDFELVFNDWGLFYETRKNFPRIKLLLGRLLTKQKTDPRAKIVFENKDKINLNDEIFNNMYEHFQGSLINDKLVQKFLIEQNIKRLEIEYLLWDMKIELQNNIKASIYYPYAHISTTRNCGVLNMTYLKCNKICRETKMKYNIINKTPYIVIGNTIYYDIENIMTEDKLKKYPSIDRIVFNDTDAYYRYINGNRNK